jgi:hypothetical protein
MACISDDMKPVIEVQEPVPWIDPKPSVPARNQPGVLNLRLFGNPIGDFLIACARSDERFEFNARSRGQL